MPEGEPRYGLFQTLLPHPILPFIHTKFRTFPPDHQTMNPVLDTICCPISNILQSKTLPSVRHTSLPLNSIKNSTIYSLRICIYIYLAPSVISGSISQSKAFPPDEQTSPSPQPPTLLLRTSPWTLPRSPNSHLRNHPTKTRFDTNSIMQDLGIGGFVLHVVVFSSPYL